MISNRHASAALKEPGSRDSHSAGGPAPRDVDQSGETTLYSSTFFAVQQDGSIQSAEILVPLVLSRFQVSSVVDVGCGVGGWLNVFSRHGITDYLGIDGAYVPLDMLKIPADKFRAEDLVQLLDIGRAFDLACCMEVAEHLPESCAEQLVTALVTAAPVILFSAAIPRQGGTAHVNEQWPSYWAEKFGRRGYVAVDCIRPAMYGNPRVDWWYRQNALIFCRPERCPTGYEPVRSAYELNRVDPSMIEHLFVPDSGTEAVRTINRALPVLGSAILNKLNIKPRSFGQTPRR
jgi:SAM-dependent methyltransferase